MMHINKLFNNKYGVYPEAILFILSLCIMGIVFFSFYIPFVIPIKFNAFNKEQLKQFSILIFGSYHYLFYIVTWLSTWFFLFIIVFNIVVSLCFIDVCFEAVLSKTHPIKTKISYIGFSILMITVDFFTGLYVYTTFLNF